MDLFLASVHAEQAVVPVSTDATGYGGEFKSHGPERRIWEFPFADCIFVESPGCSVRMCPSDKAGEPPA